MDPSLRRKIAAFVQVVYKQEGIVPSVRILPDHFKEYSGVSLSRDAIYRAFPGGMREICREAGVPVHEERYRATAGATAKRKTAKPSGRGIRSDATDLDKVVFAELRRGLQPVEIVEKYGNAEKVLRLAKIFRQAQRLSTERERH